MTGKCTVAVQKVKRGNRTPTGAPWRAFFVISPGPAAALLCHREMLMCVMCSLRVCIPGEILGAEAGERNESCAVNHSLPRRRRRGDACRKQLHTKRTTATHREVGYISTCLSAVCSTDALAHAEWHISTLGFFFFLTRSNFASRAISFRSSFVRWPTCLLKPALTTAKAENVGGRGCEIKGWSHNVHTVIPPPFTAEPLPLKPALFHSLFHTPAPPKTSTVNVGQISLF